MPLDINVSLFLAVVKLTLFGCDGEGLVSNLLFLMIIFMYYDLFASRFS